MKANYANALSHLNAMPLSVAVLAPCAWSENLARGGAWQSVVNLATKRHSKASTTNSLWQAFVGKTTHDKFGAASVAKVLAVLVGETKRGDIANSARRKYSGACKRKWGSVWAGDFSLVARTCGTPLG